MTNRGLSSGIGNRHATNRIPGIGPLIGSEYVQQEDEIHHMKPVNSHPTSNVSSYRPIQPKNIM